jgi:N-methylhydantoinase A
MQSNGGITTAERAAREPVRTILSGPAGGVVAARRLADQLGIRRAISFDMGGTSTDVCLLAAKRSREGGIVSPATTRETTLGGLPVAVPALDVHSVGAGGGSLARLDAGGALRVGPESAGASPGPVCYGRGGTEPTVTDAHLLLGRLDPEHFLGGEFRLAENIARESFDAFLRAHRRRESNRQARLTSARDLARGMVAVANANMEKALRVISVERGHDPRDFSLVSFGGAGGLHACDLARALRLVQVIVPPNPGAFSALGVLLSDIVKDVSQSVLLPVPANGLPVPVSGNRTGAQAMQRFSGQIEERFERLERQARAELRRDRLPANSAAVERSLDLRYVGQSYELAVPFVADFCEQFHRAHEKVYGYADPRRAVEVVNLRVRLTIPTPKPAIRRASLRTASNPDGAVIRRKTAWFEGRAYPTPLYERARLAAGTQFRGPAVVIEYSSTTVIPPDFVCHVDEFLNLILGQNAR